ncbi:hypothetical protein THIX_20264 [Thiomonas sp. X19]|nr:hypothetical protein THIX_20264 [Thiomonas sp. X19]
MLRSTGSVIWQNGQGLVADIVVSSAWSDAQRGDTERRTDIISREAVGVRRMSSPGMHYNKVGIGGVFRIVSSYQLAVSEKLTPRRADGWCR